MHLLGRGLLARAADADVDPEEYAQAAMDIGKKAAGKDDPEGMEDEPVPAADRKARDRRTRDAELEEEEAFDRRTRDAELEEEEAFDRRRANDRARRLAHAALDRALDADLDRARDAAADRVQRLGLRSGFFFN